MPLNGLYDMKKTINNERNIAFFFFFFSVVQNKLFDHPLSFWSKQKMVAMTNSFATSKIPGIFISTNNELVS